MNEGNSIRLEGFHQLTKQIRGSEQHLIVPLSSLDPEKSQKEIFDPLPAIFLAGLSAKLSRV